MIVWTIHGLLVIIILFICISASGSLRVYRRAIGRQSYCHCIIIKKMTKKPNFKIGLANLFWWCTFRYSQTAIKDKIFNPRDTKTPIIINMIIFILITIARSSETVMVIVTIVVFNLGQIFQVYFQILCKWGRYFQRYCKLMCKNICIIIFLDVILTVCLAILASCF